MARTPRRLPGLVLLGAWLALAGPAWAVYPPPIKDEAKLFSAEALEKANKKIKETYQNSRKDLVIETYAAIPADLVKKFNELDKNKEKFFAGWARERVKELGVNGVYVLICKSPTYYYTEADPETRKKAFTAKDQGRLRAKMLEALKEKKFDAGLLEWAELVEGAFKANLGK
jgi:hypothetical protein